MKPLPLDGKLRWGLLALALSLLLAVSAQAGEDLALTCSAAPESGAPPLEVRFTCKAEGAKGKPAYSWTFGDGEKSTQAGPTHVYRRIGNFTAAVEVKDGAARASWTGTVRVALEKTVEVGADGGAAELKFPAAKGQRIRIRMKALDVDMEPYGHLESASGGDYRPRNEDARDGANSWEGTVPDTGTYVLTVFDGSGGGGRVAVTVEEP